MRKYLYAGAVVGGFLLLVAAPAHADGQGEPAGGLHLTNPLGGSPLIDVKPGANSPDVPGGVIPDGNGVPAARTGLGRPAGGPRAGGLPTGALGAPPLSNLSVSNVPISTLPGGGMLAGLTPDGSSAASGGDAAQESGPLGDGLLSDLGGLDGLLPAFSTPPPAFSGMPAGGTPVTTTERPTARPAKPAAGPATTKPAVDPAAAKPAVDPATANDPRLHEEPTDPEGKTGATPQRTFSDGRPVAGVDPQYR